MKQENFVENIPGILLLSHGPFCQALLESAQMIGGEAVNVVALPLLENASIDEYGEKAMQTFKQMPEGSIVLFDLASGTPFNQMMMKSGGEEFPGLCGMNLPVLLEAMTMREAMKGSELVALLEESAKAAVVNIKSFFRTVSRVHNFCGREVSTCAEIMCYNLSWKRHRHRIFRA